MSNENMIYLKQINTITIKQLQFGFNTYLQIPTSQFTKKIIINK